MFTHRAEIQLKNNSFILFSRKIDNKIMPLLRLQKGFQNGTTSVFPERSTAIEDTHWNTREDAEAYNQEGYLEVVDILSEVFAAAPVTSIFEDTASTLDQADGIY